MTIMSESKPSGMELRIKGLDISKGGLSTCCRVAVMSDGDMTRETLRGVITCKIIANEAKVTFCVKRFTI